MIKNIRKPLLLTAVLFWLSIICTSCSTEKKDNHTAPSKKDLISCDSKREGETWLVLDKKEEYRCTQGNWILQSISSSSVTPKETLSIEKISAYLEDSLAKTQESATDSLSSSEASSSSSIISSSSSLTISSSSVSSSSFTSIDSSVTDTLAKDSLLSDSSATLDSIPKDSLADTLCAEIPAGMTCDKRDGTLYPLVKIGSQTWFAKNLNFNAPSSFCYENNAANCSRYGRLYRWSTALALDEKFNQEVAGELLTTPRQGVCPEGFRIPSAQDFSTLANYVEQKNGDEGIGTSLKKGEWWEENDEAPIGTDKFGFAGLPAGYRAPNGSFNFLGNDLSFWIAEEAAKDKAPFWNLYAENDKFIGTYVNNKTYAYSVRCIKN